ncbi:MAG: hypothetical protein D6784_03400 [Chloroflexi bacterium]|nr:MAG: hypothetical protein D6784_03400 [Chloroflexota bacterium]
MDFGETRYRGIVSSVKNPGRIRRILTFSIRLMLLLGVLFGVGPSATPPRHALTVQLAEVTAPYRFDFVNWESYALLDELNRRLSPPPVPADTAAQTALVEAFLAREATRADLERQLKRLYALCPQRHANGCSAAQARQLAQLQSRQDRLTVWQTRLAPLVETILARQTETILRDEGFVWLGMVFPPVAFRFVDPPTALIISPRARIENRYFVPLRPGLDIPTRERIESALDRRGDISSYVTDIGGLGSYPTMVIYHDSLTYLTETIAHEWTHNYLFTFPTNIAWGYQTFPRLTTINETTAEIVGQEISRKLITRFYPDWVDKLPPLDEAGQPAPRPPSEFDLALRRIRRYVDQLLAGGKIEEAESYMEAERQKLVAKGYSLRKLNQAYFAFHGSYAASPASIDPTGPQLRQLRAASPSLQAFLNRVGWLNSYQDYLAWLQEAGLSPDPHK